MGNVFRSVLASARALLQNKTVTAGTSNISVQADSGYDGLDTVTVQPTPTEIGSATPTTSSQTISPSSGKHLSSVTVEAIPSEYVIPTDITPSNSSPVALTSGSAYKPDASGYAISSYSSVSPSSSPTTLSSDSIYKMSSGGYAINSYSSSSKTPSSSGTYFSSGWNYMNSSGYAYSSQPSTSFRYKRIDSNTPTSVTSSRVYFVIWRATALPTLSINGSSITKTDSFSHTVSGTIHYFALFSYTNLKSSDSISIAGRGYMLYL